MPANSESLPLGALRAFVAAAQVENFKRAAQMLGVTPAAVSAQVRTLEAYLGCSLFERCAQSVALTPVGRQFAKVCDEALGRLEQAAREARQAANRPSVTVGVGALIGAQWLSRRLASFWQRSPDTSLHLRYSPGGVEFADGETDMMLAWGDGRWPGLASEELLRMPVAPVAAAGLLAGRALPLAPADLLSLPLLHWKDTFDWQEWFGAHGVEAPAALTGVVFDDSSVLLRAALSGQGVALGLLPLIDDALQSGQLRQLFEPAFAPSRAYHLIYPPSALRQPHLRAFRDWLAEEAARCR